MFGASHASKENSRRVLSHTSQGDAGAVLFFGAAQGARFHSARRSHLLHLRSGKTSLAPNDLLIYVLMIMDVCDIVAGCAGGC